MKRFLLLAVAAGALGGCVSLLPSAGPTPRIFVLEGAHTSAPTVSAPLDVVVGIGAPGGARATLGPDLIWRKGDEIAFVARAQWSSRAGEALQSLVVDALNDGGRVRAAAPLGESLTDYAVRWDVTQFEVVEDTSGYHARFVANARVMRAASREVLRAGRVEASYDFSDRSASQAADALTRAAREGGARLADFVVTVVAADQSSAASTSR